MITIDANDLAVHSDDILQQLDQTGQPIDITRNGIIVARIIPFYDRSTPRDLAAFWSDWNRMSSRERGGVGEAGRSVR